MQSVHQLREQARQAAEAAWVRANGEVLKAEAKVQENIRLRDRTMEEYVAMFLSGSLSAHEAALHTGYMTVLEERIREAQRELQQRQVERDAARRRLLEASVQAEATAKLRELQVTRHRAEVEREEQNQLDEISAIRATRRRMD